MYILSVWGDCAASRIQRRRPRGASFHPFWVEPRPWSTATVPLPHVGLLFSSCHLHFILLVPYRSHDLRKNAESTATSTTPCERCPKFV